MRVLYIARAPFVSGAERALASMLRQLDRQKVEAGVVLGHETALGQDIQKMGWPVWQVELAKREMKSWFAWRKSTARLQAIAREFGAQLLHANDVPSCQAMSVVGGQMGLPRVVHVRWGVTAGEMAWWARAGCESIVCISAWVKDHLGQTGGTCLAQARTTVLADAVDWPAQGALEPTGRAARGREEPLVLGFAGQLIPSKGLDVVIRALGKLEEKDRPTLLVAGEDTQTGGKYQAELQALAQSEGVAEKVRWLGFLAGVGKLYEQVDAVICPSRVEPLGLVPLEAAEYGLPAAAHRVGGLAETIAPGQTGWLVEAEDVAGWSRVLKEMGENPAQVRALGRRAWERTRQGYSPQVYQAGLLAIYEGLLQRQG